MEWIANKDGMTLTFTKGDLIVVWEPCARKYEVFRVSGGNRQALEKGRSPHLPMERFLRYVDKIWNTNK